MNNFTIAVCASRKNIAADVTALALNGSQVIEIFPDKLSLAQTVVSAAPDAVIVHIDDIGEDELCSAFEFLESSAIRPAYIIIGQSRRISEKFSYVRCFFRLPDRRRLEESIKALAAPNTEPKMYVTPKDLELAITEIIMKIGIPPNIKGYRYLRCGVMLAVHDMSVLDSVTKRLYPSIADRFNTTASCVERAIRHAIACAWDKGSGDIAFIESKLRCRIDFFGEKPTNSELIALISDSMRLNACA